MAPQAIGEDYLRSHGHEKDIPSVFPKSTRERLRDRSSGMSQLEVLAAAIDELRAEVDELRRIVNGTANSTTTTGSSKHQ